MTNKVIFARGRPESVSLKETYAYRLLISRNQTRQSGVPPEGKLEIVVPYDGQRYFTRAACADVEQQLGGTNPSEDVDAQVGHVLLANYDRTDLKNVLNLGEHYDALPIQVPVVSNEIFSPEHLYEDQRAALISHSYQPQVPEVIPIDVRMEITDETSFRAEDKRSIEQISKYVSVPFQLSVELEIWIDLPNTTPSSAKPRIARAAFEWPTLTSFRTLKLEMYDLASVAPSKRAKSLKKHKALPLRYRIHKKWNTVPLRYNPAKTCIEWEDIKLHERKPSDAKTRVFRSPPMRLQIGYPGELYRQPRLKGTVEVEIKDVLLTGVDVRVFDGAGMHVKRVKPGSGEDGVVVDLATRIVVDLELLLADAFAQRVASPYQQLFFDEVIPDPMRLADILITLGDHGFHVDEPVYPYSSNKLRSIITASRAEGPHTMLLWLYVDGTRNVTERQTELPGGQFYTSTFTSGDLTIHMLGQLPGNVYELTRRMNAIQASLCERFARLRTKR